MDPTQPLSKQGIGRPSLYTQRHNGNGRMYSKYFPASARQYYSITKQTLRKNSFTFLLTRFHRERERKKNLEKKKSIVLQNISIYALSAQLSKI